MIKGCTMKFLKTFIVVISLSINNCYGVEGNSKILQKNVSKGKVVLELNYLPDKILPGDKPISLSDDLIAKILPELKNPRLMNLADIKDPEEQYRFFEDGYTFVLRGDFNRDGFADIVFVGKYNQYLENSFIAIISIKGNKVIRDYFTIIYRGHIGLVNLPSYKPKQKINAIGMSYNLSASDCGFLHWDGKYWLYDDCED